MHRRRILLASILHRVICMKSTLTYVGAAVIVGIVAGIAVGYWEARPWTVSNRVASGSGDVAKGSQGDDDKDSLAEPDADVPHAIAPESVFKFGNMESGSVQQHTFPLRNDGKAPLIITFVSHTCKCTKVQFD